MVSDVKSVAGTWQGVVYEPGSEPDYVELTIREDGSYDLVSRQAIGGSRGRGGAGTSMRNPAGDLVMNIDATLSDNSTLSAQQLARRALPTDSYAASHPLSAKGSE